MTSSFQRLIVGAVILAVFSACSDYGSNSVTYPPPAVPPGPVATVLAASGNISAKVDEFRALLGDPSNGGTAGEQATGRREISWDGAGANPFNNKNDFTK